MSFWGDEWGGLWGEGRDASDRLLMFIRSGPLASLAALKGDRSDALIGLCEDITESFDLDTATGDRLDKLGSILQRARQGADDDEYRKLLKVQVRLILSSNASVATILQIVELFTEVPPASYQNNYPMGFTVGAVASTEDATRLRRLLEQAAGAAYGVGVFEHEADWLVLDYEPGDPVDGAGILDYEPGDPVTGAGSTVYGET